MKIYGKDGEMVICDKTQLKIMLEAGFTRTPDSSEVKEEGKEGKETAETQKDEGDSSVSDDDSKSVRKKLKKKKD